MAIAANQPAPLGAGARIVLATAGLFGSGEEEVLEDSQSPVLTGPRLGGCLSSGGDVPLPAFQHPGSAFQHPGARKPAAPPSVRLPPPGNPSWSSAPPSAVGPVSSFDVSRPSSALGISIPPSTNTSRAPSPLPRHNFLQQPLLPVPPTQTPRSNSLSGLFRPTFSSSGRPHPPRSGTSSLRSASPSTDIVEPPSTLSKNEKALFLLQQGFEMMGEHMHKCVARRCDQVSSRMRKLEEGVARLQVKLVGGAALLETQSNANPNPNSQQQRAPHSTLPHTISTTRPATLELQDVAKTDGTDRKSVV